jgi:hypothetical protein
MFGGKFVLLRVLWMNEDSVLYVLQYPGMVRAFGWSADTDGVTPSLVTRHSLTNTQLP